LVELAHEQDILGRLNVSLGQVIEDLKDVLTGVGLCV
jgi:hypothetical protein